MTSKENDQDNDDKPEIPTSEIERPIGTYIENSDPTIPINIVHKEGNTQA